MGMEAERRSWMRLFMGELFFKPVHPSVEQIIDFYLYCSFIKVANETMCRPIRALTEARGHATSRHM
jgi:hypothetical protein